MSGLATTAATRLALFSGWTWVAVGSLIGFEMLEILFGSFLIAPELFPVVLAVLAAAWFFRDRLRRVTKRVHVRIRAIRRLRDDRQPSR